jgi:hypothetical protein
VSVDLSKIKPGDEVTVRAVVREIAGPFVRSDGKAWDIKVRPHAFVHSEWIEHDAIVTHTPKALSVGDRVRVKNSTAVRTVLALHGQYAWLSDGESCWTEELDYLERAP